MEGLWRPEAFLAAALELGDVAVSLTHASKGSVQGAGLIVRLSSCLPQAPSEARPPGCGGPPGNSPPAPASLAAGAAAHVRPAGGHQPAAQG